MEIQVSSFDKEEDEAVGSASPGNLVTAQRAARTGRNPATGESIKITAKASVKFRLGKAAKDAIVPPKK